MWQRYGGTVLQEFRSIDEDAEAFASAHEQKACVPEALDRLETCDGVWCMARTPIFTKECLRQATRSPDLCDDVPDSLPLAVLWPATTCADLDVQSEVCQRILRELVKVCLPERF